LYERIGFLNCNHFAVDLDVVLSIDADFQDIFSIRGFKTQRVAGQISVTFGGDDLLFWYLGRDGLARSTVVTFSEVPEAIAAREVRFSLRLEPKARKSIVVRAQPRLEGESTPMSPDFDAELDRLAGSYREWDETSTTIATGNELFDRELLRASRYDLRTLVEQSRFGLVPDAGIPWYAVPFGRDAIITALQSLMYNPQLAEGTLRFLAANQGQVVDPYKEEEPGKIMHELRRGELARLHEVPHTPYFGTVDATRSSWSSSLRLCCGWIPINSTRISYRLPCVRWNGSTDTATVMATDTSNTSRIVPVEWSIRVGRIRSTRCNMRMAPRPLRRSRWLKCRATSIRPRWAWRTC
jgi:glycogen debranching enzyme